MQIGEEKKDENRYQDLSLHWREERCLGHQRSKQRSPSPVQNRNTWLSSTHPRSKSGFTASSKKSATTSATKRPSTATIRVLSPSHTIRNTMHIQSISTSNTTSSGTALKMERHSWNTVQWRIWWQMD